MRLRLKVQRQRLRGCCDTDKLRSGDFCELTSMFTTRTVIHNTHTCVYKWK